MYYWPITTALFGICTIWGFLCSLTALFIIRLWVQGWFPDLAGADGDGGDVQDGAAVVRQQLVVGQAVQLEQVGARAAGGDDGGAGQPDNAGDPAPEDDRGALAPANDDDGGSSDNDDDDDDGSDDQLGGGGGGVRRRVVPAPGGASWPSVVFTLRLLITVT